MALAGAAVGLTIAMFGARIMSSLVYGVEPRDAVSMAAAAGLLLAVAALASYIPSRRAAGADPGLTLRAD
jgi:putative ABC transport system permease protein